MGKKWKQKYKRLGKQAAQARKQGFSQVQDINEAAYGNLKRHVKGARKTLTKANAKDLARLEKVANNLSSAGRKTTKNIDAKEASFGTMGGMLSGRFNTSRDRAARENEYTEKSGQAGVKASSEVSRAGDKLLQMAQAETGEAQAGADYMSNVALKERTTQEVLQIAQMRHQEQMQRQAHRLEVKRMEQAAAIEEKKMKKLAGSQFGQVSKASKFLTNVAADIMQLKSQGLNDPMQLANQIAIQHGIKDPNGQIIPGHETDWEAVVSLTRSLTSNTKEGLDSIAEETVAVLRSAVPSWSNLGDDNKWIKYIMAQLAAADAQRRAALSGRGAEDSSSGGTGFVAGAHNHGGNPFKAVRTPESLLDWAWNSDFIKAATLRG